MAILGGSEWKCIVLDRGHDGSHAHLALYLQDDLANLLRPAAGAGESGKRPGCPHLPDRTLRFVAYRRICWYAAPFWRRSSTFKLSRQRLASARSRSHSPDY